MSHSSKDERMIEISVEGNFQKVDKALWPQLLDNVIHIGTCSVVRSSSRQIYILTSIEINLVTSLNTCCV